MKWIHLAEKRQQVLQNPMGADELLESLHGHNTELHQKRLQQNFFNLNSVVKMMK